MPERVAPALSVDQDTAMDQGTDDVLERILDAAAELFTRHGVRRTSVEDVARRARVGRNTVFRRLGSKDELVHAVMARELRRIFGALDRVAAAAAGPLDRVAGIFATAITALRSSPMAHSTLHEHPDEIGELTAFAGGEFMRASTAYVAEVLTADRDRGDLRDDLDVEVVAETVVRLVHSVLLVPDLARPLQSDAELRTFAASILKPHLI
jgi:AcrR family transcriptional regulator